MSPSGIKTLLRPTLTALLAAALVGCAGIPIGAIDDGPWPTGGSAPEPEGPLRVIVIATRSATLLQTPGLAGDPMPPDGTIKIGNDGADTEWRGLLGFDLGALPRGARVRSARLILNAAGRPGGRSPEATLIVAPALRPWRPGEVTWTTQPPADEARAASSGLQRNLRVETLDVTAILQTWLDQAEPPHGLLLRCESSGPFFKNFTGTTAALVADAPRIEIEYTPPPPRP